MLEMLYTLLLISLGCAMLVKMATRKPKTPQQVLARRARQQGQRVNTFPVSRRPARRQTVTLSMALAYYLAAATRLIERTIYDLRKGWRAGRAVFVMSPTERPIPKADPIPAPAQLERERELGTAPERAPELPTEGDIISRTITKRQADLLEKKFKPLVDQKLLTITDIAVLMSLRTAERAKQVSEILDTVDTIET